MLYNTADMERGGAGDGDTVAILEGTQLCCTRQLRDLLHCLGGVSVLLPLFAQLGEWPLCISFALHIMRSTQHLARLELVTTGCSLSAHRPKALSWQLLVELHGMIPAIATDLP